MLYLRTEYPVGECAAVETMGRVALLCHLPAYMRVALLPLGVAMTFEACEMHMRQIMVWPLAQAWTAIETAVDVGFPALSASTDGEDHRLGTTF